MRLDNAHILVIKKQKMEKEQMIKTIKAYEQELNANWEELADAFGYSDEATQKAFTEWMVMEELLTRLKLTPNEK